MVVTGVRPKSKRKEGTIIDCQDCQEELTDDNWSPSMQKYRRYICKECWSARQRKYEEHRRETRPDILEYRRKQYKERRDAWSPERKEIERKKNYDYYLKKHYGITINDYELMNDFQGGRCAICDGEDPKGQGGFHVDHCHDTGKVRSLLCTSCNMMLGLVKDSEETLMKAISYLRRHSQPKDEQETTRHDHSREARLAANGKKF